VRCALGVGAFALGLIAIAVILSSNHVNPRGLGPTVAPGIGWSVAGVGVVRRSARTSRSFPREIGRCSLSTPLRPQL
jgi:hypothetical protein